MGKNLRDRIADIVEDATDKAAEEVEDRTGKTQCGFEPSVCQGCPKRGGGKLQRCGLCGCPTFRGGTLDKTNMVPNGCPRMEQHSRLSSYDGD